MGVKFPRAWELIIIPAGFVDTRFGDGKEARDGAGFVKSELYHPFFETQHRPTSRDIVWFLTSCDCSKPDKSPSCSGLIYGAASPCAQARLQRVWHGLSSQGGDMQDGWAAAEPTNRSLGKKDAP